MVTNLIIEINSCRVLYLLVLLVHGLHQLGVGMPNADRHDPTESVQIPPSRLVIKILLLALNNHYRLFSFIFQKREKKIWENTTQRVERKGLQYQQRRRKRGLGAEEENTHSFTLTFS